MLNETERIYLICSAFDNNRTQAFLLSLLVINVTNRLKLVLLCVESSFSCTFRTMLSPTPYAGKSINVEAFIRKIRTPLRTGSIQQLEGVLLIATPTVLESNPVRWWVCGGVPRTSQRGRESLLLGRGRHIEII